MMTSHPTLREKILQYVRNAILSGAIEAGSRVSEPEIARRYGISRTPIREAFRQLESEGYLTIVPRKGAVVNRFSPRDVSEFSSIIALLEGFAARCACGKMSQGSLERLHSANRRMACLAAQNNLKCFSKANGEFHRLIIEEADNEKLRELIAGLATKFQSVRLAMLSGPGNMERVVGLHRSLLEAFCENDAERAEMVIRQEVALAMEYLQAGNRAGSLIPPDIGPLCAETVCAGLTAPRGFKRPMASMASRL